MDTTIAMRLMHLAADGLGLCEDALGELGSARVRELVAQTAAAKRELLGSLRWLAGYHRWLIAPVGTVTGFASNLWTKLKATVCDDDETIYIRHLADRELQFELAFEDALRAANDPTLLQILNYHAPQLRACSNAVGALRARLEA